MFIPQNIVNVRACNCVARLSEAYEVLPYLAGWQLPSRVFNAVRD